MRQHTAVNLISFSFDINPLIKCILHEQMVCTVETISVICMTGTKSTITRKIY
jgi:hypothetical protein